MAYAPATHPVETLQGAFTHKETGKLFEWEDRSELHWAPDYPHIVWVGPIGAFRYARVLKTVAYIVTDESDSGEPIAEKWPIRTNWDRK
jgi:hypothetical protein